MTRVNICRCPLCGSEDIVFSQKHYNEGTDKSYNNWCFRCVNCGLVRLELPADDFQNREYFETMEEAVNEWNLACFRLDISKGGICK